MGQHLKEGSLLDFDHFFPSVTSLLYIAVETSTVQEVDIDIFLRLNFVQE